MIPNCIPNLSGRERDYLLEALDGNHLAVGPFIARFEAAMCDYTGAAHGVAVSSGSAALHLALLAAGVTADDEVLVPALTFAATANAVRYCGAWPLFTDCEPLSWGMDAAQAEAFLSHDCERRDSGLFNRLSDRRVKAMVPVHLYGHPADMDPLVDLAIRHGLALVEDGAESLGATYKGRPVGSLHQTCILSFNGNKVITAGGGGMVLTANEAVAKRCRYLANQAKADTLDFVHAPRSFRSWHPASIPESMRATPTATKALELIACRTLRAHSAPRGLGESGLPPGAFRNSGDLMFSPHTIFSEILPPRLGCPGGKPPIAPKGIAEPYFPIY